MSVRQRFELTGADGKLIRGDRADGKDRQILFITGFLSKRWGNKSRALAEWCQEKGWGFCCYDVRGFGDSEGAFTDYTLSDWIEDARAVIYMLKSRPHLTHPPQAISHPPAPEPAKTGSVAAGRASSPSHNRRQFTRRLDRLADGTGVQAG